MILTSHYMQDVQELCERVIVIDHGTIIFDGTLDALSSRYSDVRRLRLRLSKTVDEQDFAPFGEVTERDDDSVVLSIARDKAPQITAAVLAALPVADISIEEVSIDEVIRTLFAAAPPA